LLLLLLPEGPTTTHFAKLCHARHAQNPPRAPQPHLDQLPKPCVGGSRGRFASDALRSRRLLASPPGGAILLAELSNVFELVASKGRARLIYSGANRMRNFGNFRATIVYDSQRSSFSSLTAVRYQNRSCASTAAAWVETLGVFGTRVSGAAQCSRRRDLLVP
jgi:hypothetical protein